MSKLGLSKETWTSQTVFIMAAIGSAVGLGNLWKFPYITGEYGGSAFLMVYLFCVLLVGLPLLIAEISAGRAGNANPVQAMSHLAQHANSTKLWGILGANGILAAGFILSFYSVIAGWSAAYFFSSLFGQFNGTDVDQIGNYFNGLLASPEKLILWHTLFSIATILIVSQGVKSGIEKAINWMIPGLMLILLVLFFYVVGSSGFDRSVDFLFTPDFSKLTWEAVLVAVGHAFFTLSLGLGVMMVYGSYLSERHSIVKASVLIVIADTAIALLAGLIIFSIVFSNGLEPGSGPGLLFQTLPIAFGNMWGGWIFGTLFFGLVVIAALSSAISLIEPAVSWMQHNWKMQRKTATWLFGGLMWLLGMGTVLSFNHWSDVHFLPEKTFFDSLDFLTANIMLPLGGLILSLFVGWVMDKKQLAGEVRMAPKAFAAYVFLLKYIVPTLLAVVFIGNLLA